MKVNYSETLLTVNNSTPLKVRAVIKKETLHTPAEGIGINITFDQQAAGEYPRDKKNWTCLLNELSFLSPAWLCVTLPVEGILDSRGKVKKDACALKEFDYICRWAQTNGVSILLMFPKSAFSNLRFHVSKSHSPAPSDLNEYGALIISLLRYLVYEKKYSIIKYLTICGEPFNEDGGDFSFATPAGIDPYRYYIEMHKTVRRMLDENGLEDIGLVGPNSSDVYAYTETIRRCREKKLNLFAPLSAIDLHAYRMRIDYLPPSSHVFTLPLSTYADEYINPIVKDAKRRKKPVFITELGCMYYGKSSYGDNRGPSRHEAFIAEAELILRGLNAGIDGFLKWVYIFNISQQRGHYHVIERSGNGYLRKDGFYGYAALCRHFPRGARLLKLVSKDNSQFVHMAAIETKEKNVTVFIVNNHPANLHDIEISLQGARTKKPFNIRVVDTWDKYKSKGVVKLENGKLRVQVTPLSLTVLTTICSNV